MNCLLKWKNFEVEADSSNKICLQQRPKNGRVTHNQFEIAFTISSFEMESVLPNKD